MKRISLLSALFILAVMLCDPSNTLPQSGQAGSKTENQTQAPSVVPAESMCEVAFAKLSNSEFESSALTQETPVVEAPENTHTEPDEPCAAPPARPEPITESKSEKPPVKEVTSATPRSGSGLPGFDDVPYLGPNVCIYVEDMYENGNKIGIMGDINKQVGIMD